MKNKFLKSLRLKLILYVFICGLSAYALANLMLMLGQKLHTRPFIHQVLTFFSEHVGIQAMVYITAFALFVAFVLLISRGSFRYLESIVSGIRKMENGDLGVRVEVRSDDELGVLASAVNRMAEKLQRSIEEERRAEAAKKELISNVSHDLRTPLTSVIGFLGLLKARSGQTEEDLEKYASIAHTKSLRLKDLIDDLFEYTRVSYSGIKVENADLDIQELLRQLAEEYYPVFEEQGMVLEQAYTSEKLIVAGDGELLMRLFENLIQNALRYGKDGKNIQITVSKEGSFASVRIVNHGNPIPEEKMPYIFDRFYRVEDSRSRETGGSGLGLAIAKNVAELHNGNIHVRSSIDETCFEVNLPLKREEGSHVQG